ncbi:MAG: hypothetical protein HC902_06500 [Calothrix sp. SM1_5_4]|nr:hypothetical protein [Calothrix sp. SM1_5_4]
MQQNSNVLVVGAAAKAVGDSFGADHVASFSEARSYLERARPAVLVFGGTTGEEFEKFCHHVLEHSPHSLWIVAADRVPPSQLTHWRCFGRLHDIVDGFDDPELEGKLRSALEAFGEVLQSRKLVELFEEQSERLKRLSTDLELRVQRRHKALRKSLKTLDKTNSRMKALHQALLGIYRAPSVRQMEQALNEALGEAIPTLVVRVRFESQSLLKRQMGDNVLALELPFRDEGLRGEVLFSKTGGERISPTETDFLYELSERPRSRPLPPAQTGAGRNGEGALAGHLRLDPASALPGDSGV